ncbi:hypothetical protein [Rhizobium leguminosarum]|uniref:hypothetical protein n=1 Tax=Rhizobium leguminosarum TaxID=384 RepID=UPI0011AE8FB3|nr:hypothetical protein [Rhizobium leguminosarum]
MRMNTEMKLGRNLHRAGCRKGAWLHPSLTVIRETDIDQYAQVEALAEDAAFQFVFFSEHEDTGRTETTLASGSWSAP